MRYSIPEWNIESLEKKIVKIRNKCAKYGCEFKYERDGEHFEEVSFSYKDEFDGEIKHYKEVVKFIDVEVEGTAAINGWKYAASLEYHDAGNIIKAVPGFEIPKRYYECAPWCEHCKTNRDRKYSFVVFEEATGEFKQVGKACLKDFTGGLSAEDAAFIESFFKTVEEASHFSGFGGFGKKYFETREMMNYFAETVRVFGYVKTDCPDSTADRAQTFYEVDHDMISGRNAEYARAERDAAAAKGFDPKNPESVALAGEVIDWVLGNERDDNYFHNLKVAASLEYITVRNFGILASAFPAHNRQLERDAEEAARKAREAEESARSQYVGEIGKRVSFKPVSVVCVTSWETMYGTTHIFKIEDADGHVFTWKTGNYISLSEREPIEKITGTVKDHTEYRGVKQTELTRCRVEYGKKKGFFDPPEGFDAEAARKAQEERDKAFEMFWESVGMGSDEIKEAAV